MRQMKDSGIEWIGEIPEMWTVEMTRHIFSQRNTKGNETPVLLAATQKCGMIPQEKLEGVVQVKRDTNLQTFKTIHKGDFVISLRSFQGGFEMSDYEGVCSPAYQVFYSTKEIIHQYYKYLFKSENFINKVNSFTVGIREGKNIQYVDFSYMRLPYPPLEIQQRIATFLDSKCGEVDSMIALQEEMISELQAYKQSVITEAVTHGLNPHAKMKDSGIEWIGEIPEHWNIKKIRFLGTTQNGISKSGNYFGSGYPFISYGDVYKNTFLPNNVEGLANSSEEDQKIYSVKEGDVFFTRTSETIEEIGFSCACLKTIPKATFSGFLIRMRPNTDELYPAYSGYYFRSNLHRSYFVKEMNLVTRASLGQTLLRNLPVLLPPIAEQKEIADFLDEKCADINELISIKQEKIESLKAYKHSIIYEYVTGKLSVKC